tara:strand:+ start:9 stop:452 length:444 start_codon:yes stop_codon:yes gene_type:complete
LEVIKGGRLKCSNNEGKSLQLALLSFKKFLYYLLLMRKLERQMNFALSNKGNWAGSNTTVTYNESTNCSQVLLHGHQIASLDHSTNALKLSSCGYQTNTTKSRLNAILDEIDYGCKVFQKNWDWYFSNNNQTVDFWDGMILCGGEIL